MTTRHRAWCFTINNWTESDYFAVMLLAKEAKYAIVGKEVGEKGTPHLQGYVKLHNACAFNSIKKYLPKAHIEVAEGSDQQNFNYCSKENNFREWGERSEGQGRRTDIKEITDLIKARSITIEDIMFEYPDMYLKYSRSFEKMFNAVAVPRTTPPEVHWRWGLAGTGKTSWVIRKHGQKNVYIKDGTMWWDGYTQQDVILIDDFDNQIPYRTLLRILDRYTYQGQVKGGYVQINSPYIFITCEYPPYYYWQGNEFQQVFRRLTSVEEIK